MKQVDMFSYLTTIPVNGTSPPYNISSLWRSYLNVDSKTYLIQTHHLHNSVCINYHARSWGSVSNSYACWMSWNSLAHSSRLSGFLSDHERPMQASASTCTWSHEVGDSSLLRQVRVYIRVDSPGWYLSARRLYAFLSSSSVAVLSTPSTS